MLDNRISPKKVKHIDYNYNKLSPENYSYKDEEDNKITKKQDTNFRISSKTNKSKLIKIKN